MYASSAIHDRHRMLLLRNNIFLFVKLTLKVVKYHELITLPPYLKVYQGMYRLHRGIYPRLLCPFCIIRTFIIDFWTAFPISLFSGIFNIRSY